LLVIIIALLLLAVLLKDQVLPKLPGILQAPFQMSGGAVKTGKCV